jgi:hypothetical protein
MASRKYDLEYGNSCLYMEELKGYYPEDDKYFSFFDIDGSSSLSVGKSGYRIEPPLYLSHLQ